MMKALSRTMNTQKKYKVILASCLIALVMMTIPIPAHAAAIWDPIGNVCEIMGGGIEGFFSAATPASSETGTLLAPFKEMLDSTGQGSLGGDQTVVYNAMTGIHETVIVPIGHALLALVLLLELVKISQRMDAHATIPAIKEIFFLLVFAVFFIYLINNSMKICGDVYEIIRGVISEATKSGKGIDDMMFDTVDWAKVGIVKCFLLFISGFVMWLVVLVADVLSVAIIFARSIQLYIMATLSPIPFALLGMEQTRQWGIGFCKNFISVCLAGLIILLLSIVYPLMVAANGINANDLIQLVSGSGITQAVVVPIGIGVFYIKALLSSGQWAKDILGS